MPRKYAPRRGSLGYTPRKRVKELSARYKTWPESTEVKPLGFAVFKAGMTHVVGTQSRPKASNQNLDISVPVTLLAAPPMKVFGVRAYTTTSKERRTVTDVLSEKVDPTLKKRLTTLKKGKTPDFSEIENEIEKITDIRLLAHTQKSIARLGKTPDVFEIALGGTTAQEKLDYAKTVLGQELKIEDVFNENEYLDFRGATTGKGWQGPVKRWGVKIQLAKAKTHRKTGTIGQRSPHTTLWTVPMPGQMGYHNRTEINKKLLQLGTDGKNVTVKGGFMDYGTLDGVPYVMIAGSVQGPSKRILFARKSIRPPTKDTIQLSEIKYVSTESKQ